MQPLFSYRPTAYTSVLSGTYPTEIAIQTSRSHSRGFKEGDFQRGQTQRGAQPSFVGPPLTPCRRHALQRTSGSSGQTRPEQTTLTTFNITYRRAAKVYARTTERME